MPATTYNPGDKVIGNATGRSATIVGKDPKGTDRYVVHIHDSADQSAADGRLRSWKASGFAKPSPSVTVTMSAASRDAILAALPMATNGTPLAAGKFALRNA